MNTGAIQQWKEPLSVAECTDLLSLIEQAHSATDQNQFRQMLVHGTGTLIESSSCAWTELSTRVFTNQSAQTSVAEISDMNFPVDDLLPVFNAVAYQHPVISHVINTGDNQANAISDKIDREQFTSLALYQDFYKLQGIEDQLSVGYVESGTLKGLSVHRGFWGFSRKDHEMLMRIASCTFSYYRSLSSATRPTSTDAPVIQINTDNFTDHYPLLGITRRQAEILSQVACGLSNKKIAQILSISEGTVRKHLENCFRLLDVNCRVAAVTKAMSVIQRSEINPM